MQHSLWHEISPPFIVDISVPFRHGERIGFSYLISQKYTGDNAAIKVLRNSKTLEFVIKLSTHRRLIPPHVKGKPPSYYIIAGFVFTTVSVPYLRSEVHISLFLFLFRLVLFVDVPNDFSYY
jgi:hypothetical protein